MFNVCCGDFVWNFLSGGRVCLDVRVRRCASHFRLYLETLRRAVANWVTVGGTMGNYGCLLLHPRLCFCL